MVSRARSATARAPAASWVPSRKAMYRIHAWLLWGWPATRASKASTESGSLSGFARASSCVPPSVPRPSTFASSCRWKPYSNFSVQRPGNFK